ncbi:MAG: enoyl-CoA hydratase, partial [Streptosporangiaceae bacterium]|nr:enoyl-CoA hydratase [Streptosporangiaceae bacterium]
MYVRYLAADGAATLTLDSPHNRNALSAQLIAELRQGLAAAAADPAVRAVVLTHTGGTF